MTNQNGSQTLTSTKHENFSRLPKSVLPNHYFITIRPNIESFTFSGVETVNVEVTQHTNTIKVNVVDIEIQSASFLSSKNQEHQSTSIEIIKDQELAVITFANPLDLGAGQLKLEFTGEINDLMKGCYRTKYTTPNGEVRYGLATQFESTDCRRAFPCWDEPELKAKFDLTLVAPKDRVALSNMNVVEETNDPMDSTKRVLKFATTPIMSTYLLAYVIGEYEFIEQKTKNDTKVRVYTQLNKTEQGKYALDVAVRCLEFYENYFKISFPLPKLDLIAIPDFKSGAMENWGLVTYRETTLLFDPQNSSSLVKEVVSIVVCHELAHQWFGNLVTMKWWDDLWLNEGFASFMEYFAVDNLLPEFNIWESFINDAFRSALHLDSLHNSHPIQVPVNHPDEIEEIFDIISYQKGCSIIRMLHNYIGDEDFRKGMHQYLTNFAYKNTVTDDLWDALGKASGKPIRSMMSTWTKQMGYPTISFTSRQDGLNRVINLTQTKFSVDGVLNDQDQKAKWIVPIDIITQNNPKPIKFLLEEKTQEFVIENIEPTEWIKLNTNMSSFYRVDYTAEQMNQLQSSISDKSLDTIDRLNIQDDLYALVRSGKVGSDRLLKLLELYADEDKYIVWQSIISCLADYNKVLEYTDYQEVFHIYVRKLLSKIYSKLGSKPSPNEDHQTKMLRTSVISLLVSCKDPQILQEARSQFDAHVSNLAPIVPDLRSPMYRAVACDCDDKTFERFFELYRSQDLQEEKNRIARSLSATKDKARIHRIIDFAMSDEVRSQDAVFVLGSLSMSSKVGREIVWNYYKENFNVFQQKYESGSLLNRLVSLMTEYFVSEEKLQDVASFFEKNHVHGSERTVKQSLELIKSNTDLLARDTLAIKNYLSSSNQS